MATSFFQPGTLPPGSTAGMSGDPNAETWMIEPGSLTGTTYGQIGNGASDYGTYDPGGWAELLKAFSGGQGAQSSFDPNAWFQDFQNLWGGLQGMIGSETDKMRNDLLSGATRESEMARRSMADQFADMGSSGAMGAAISEAGANPFARVADEVTRARMGLMGSLGGTAMQGAQQGRMFQDQQNLGFSTLNSQNALQALLGGAGNFSTVVAPTYAGAAGLLSGGL